MNKNDFIDSESTTSVYDSQSRPPVRIVNVGFAEEPQSNAITKLQNDIDQKTEQFNQEFEEMKENQNSKLEQLRQAHFEKEQALMTNNDLEYRNLLWNITLKYFKKGSFPDDLVPLFIDSLNAEDYKIKREIVELKHQYQEELDQLSAATAPKTKRTKANKEYNDDSRKLTPAQVAQIIADNVGLAEEKGNVSIKTIKRLINQVKNENHLMAYVLNSPTKKQRRKKVKESYYIDPTYYPKKKCSNEKKKHKSHHKHHRHHHHESDDMDFDIHDHVAKRQMLVDKIKSANQFIANIKNEPDYNDPEYFTRVQ